MTNNQILELSRYRIRQANETLREAELLSSEGTFRGAVNRAYYAIFYAVQALAVIQNTVTSKHSSAIAFFDREYVKTGIFPRELSRLYHSTFEQRQEQDYGELTSIDESELFLLIQNARLFVGTIQSYLEGKIFPDLQEEE